MNGPNENTRGYLIDLDGTVYVGRQLVPGVEKTINELRERNIPFRFSTNTTTKSKANIVNLLGSLGLTVESREIFGTVEAAATYLRGLGSPRCQFLLTEDPKQDFAEFESDDKTPEFIVIGDIGKYWDYRLINDLFHKIMAGARMITLHKGRYWQTAEGLQVDIGAFVAGLEYATSTEAVVVGKPSESFWKLALRELGLPAAQVAMIGDDIHSDVGGAQAAGMKGIQVKTGKYREEFVAQSGVTPDAVIDSLATLL